MSAMKSVGRFLAAAFLTAMGVGCSAHLPAAPSPRLLECNQYCDFLNNPCDPSSGCTCSYVTGTCEPTSTWCFTNQQCQGYLMDPGARCVNFACWGTGVNCQSQQCLDGYGCQSNQDCDSGYTCSTSNGVCLPDQPASPCPTGWTWDPNYPQGADLPNGGCVPPASWPAATDCKSTNSPPACLICTQNPWNQQQNCPHIGNSTTYFYFYGGNNYCCLDSPY